MPDSSKVVPRPEAKAAPAPKAAKAAKATKAAKAPAAKKAPAPKATTGVVRKPSTIVREGTKIDAFDGKEYDIKKFGTHRDSKTGEQVRDDVIRDNRKAYAAARKVAREKAKAEAEKAKAAAAKKAPAPKAAADEAAEA